MPSAVSTWGSHGVPGFRVVGLSRWRRLGRFDSTVSFARLLGWLGLAAFLTGDSVVSRLETHSASLYLTSRPGLSLGVSKDRPSVDSSSLRPLLRCCFARSRLLGLRPRVGLPLPRDRSRSTFTVSRRPDGLLRTKPCGFVAPRCRPWGSPSFGLAPGSPCGSPGLGRSRRREHPSKLFPRLQPSPCLVPLGRACPLAVARFRHRSRDLRIVGRFPGPCGSGSRPRVLALEPFDFRALSRGSNPLSQACVST